MNSGIVSPAKAAIFGIPGPYIFTLILVMGWAVFAYILARRIVPLTRAQADPRFDLLSLRIYQVLKYGLLQWRQPRYLLSGILHILLFCGFMILSLRSLTLVFVGIWDGFVLPGLGGPSGHIYNILKDVASSIVLVVAVIAMIRRGVFKPSRYAVPERYGLKDHTFEAVFVLALISILVACDMVFDGALTAARIQSGSPAEFVMPLTGHWFAAQAMSKTPVSSLQSVNLGSYIIHELTFFFFLCFLPNGKHFHVITSLPNVFLAKTRKGRIKPVRWGIKEEDLDGIESFGVKKFEDFTWKHMLDFYSCVDCGRCSDNCPANAVGRPISPRFISIKNREYAFGNYPLFGPAKPNGEHLIGTVLDENEVWSCTTCGTCEEECPVFIEYIDKIVDLRRGMVDEGMVPQSLQKPLSALEKRGNPWGKVEKKRADWTGSSALNGDIKRADRGQGAENLFFVDSISSYDDRMQEIARSTAVLINRCGLDFCILGGKEKDSGNEVRRFGEEMLFQALKAANTEAIGDSGASRIITADPHALNVLKNEYGGLPPVEHISQIIVRGVQEKKLVFKPLEDNGKVYTYHDPCYLGRHNGLYEDARTVLDSIPGLKRVEMVRSRDRSFCCGGGGLMLFFEPEEEQRMGVLRVKMAAEAGATAIVTACPFCLVNIEDAIKVAGLEGKMEAVDLAELAARQLVG